MVRRGGDAETDRNRAARGPASAIAALDVTPLLAGASAAAGPQGVGGCSRDGQERGRGHGYGREETGSATKVFPYGILHMIPFP